jgi:acyl carrier protein
MTDNNSLAATRSLICELIAAIAPEADTSTLGDKVDMRRELDLDSIDFMNLIVALHERTGIDVPEADYHCCFTLAGMDEYLAGHGWRASRSV